MRLTRVSSTTAIEPLSFGRWSATPTTLQGNRCHLKKGAGTKSSKHLDRESAFIVVEYCLTAKSDVEKLMDESLSRALICPSQFQYHKQVLLYANNFAWNEISTKSSSFLNYILK